MEQKLIEKFSEPELTRKHDGYCHRVSDSLLITLLGNFCGLRDLNDIHDWATSVIARNFLRNHFAIFDVPSYSWFTQLLRLIDSNWLNTCFSELWRDILPDDISEKTLSFDGKTVCSTAAMSEYAKALHIVSAQAADFGITLAQMAVEGKTNESKTMRELLCLLDIRGCMVVADALNCQKETAKQIVEQGGNYLMCVKGNHPALMKDIEDYIQDEQLRKSMETAQTRELRSDRIETRTAFVTDDINWLCGRSDWAKLACIGAIKTHVEIITPGKEKITEEWHYYISSKNLSAANLLKYARAEWSVESMHWLLDVHFGEDGCKVRNKNLQENLNILRKTVINSIKLHNAAENIKRPISRTLFANLLDCYQILPLLNLKKLQN
jgi:predicted transposase YbfD/YdcC